MKNETPQTRHEQLVRFLSQFGQYRYADGSPKLSVVPNARTAQEAKDISVQEINQAAFVTADALNLEGAVIGDVDLLELMQVYLRVPEIRTQINTLVKNNFSKVYGL